MTGRFRGEGGVNKLLKIARENMQDLRADLEDVARVYASASAEIETLAAMDSSAEAWSGCGAGNGQLADVMRERRFYLAKTLTALETSREAAQERLNVASAEIAKLERLAAVNGREAMHFLGRSGVRAQAPRHAKGRQA